MDEEGSVESVFLNSDIGDPFAIFAVLGGDLTGNIGGCRINRLFSDHE